MASDDLKSRFEAVAESVKTFTPSKTVPNEEKLQAYGLFKQATVGDVNTERPGMLSFEAKAKWDAWKANEGMSTEEAMTKYIEVIERQQKEYA
eukprot:CAMPEP_0197449404 /NCGR_PEP_ID=MMETSP1175-20131217/21330_1 /TAXON_ID=1003142 /ORGANISM="Triceratium dubium, Strain CCMP147" /LENGTH=92 /DNA_ID=CAMNT_0042981531 /DNA_START=31 /DNA_END=309 /DNA_ORIENTATION=+